MAKKDKDKSEDEKDTGPVGGLAFFISLISLCIVCAAALRALVVVAIDSSILHLTQFLVAVALGFIFAPLVFHRRLSVFIHELKHSILSNLVGNKYVSLKVKKNEGAFEYKYSKETAHYNALICLAPYCLPLFSLPACILLGFATAPASLSSLFVLGLLFGVDLKLNIFDLNPIQTDLTNLRGGFIVGVLFASLMNACNFALVALVALKGFAGLKALVIGLAEILLSIKDLAMVFGGA